MEIQINIDGQQCVATVTEFRQSWGKGATFRVFDQSGSELYMFSCASHPEFEEYEKYQNMDFAEIVAELKQRLESGMYIETLKDARKNGLGRLFIRLNPAPAGQGIIH